MGPKYKDDPKLRQREEALARRVGEALDQMDPSGAGMCPDAEVIAAYAEQALEPPESAQWESHFAACGRCRKILSVLAASAATPLAEKEISRLGELVSATRGPAGTEPTIPRRSRPKFRDWRVRWLVPALGAAAALAVWFALRPPWRAMDRGATATLVAQAPKPEPPVNSVVSDQLSKVTPEESKKAEGASRNIRPSANTLQNKRETRVPSGPAAAPPPMAKATEALSVAQSHTKAELNATGQNPQSETHAGANVNAPPPGEKAPTAQRAAGPSVLPEVSSRAAMEPKTSRSLTDRIETTTTPVLMRAPSGSRLWRAGSGGQIETSVDAGQTWTLQTSPSHEEWLAGAVVSDTVCWLAGRNGAIARTADGNHWQRVTPPAQAAGAGNAMPGWTAISARDAQSATVTASDGRRFSTLDGGETWQTQ